MRFFSSPNSSRKLAKTTLPRVPFGIIASFSVAGRLTRCVRLSMFPGDGSNASPAATAASPL